MQFSGKLTEDDWRDLAVLLRPRFYWVREILTHFHGFGIVVLLLWASVLPFFRRTDTRWWVSAAVWAFLIGILVWTHYSVRRERRAELARLDETLPKSIRLTGDGITWDFRGQIHVIRWGEVKAWREQGRLVAIDTPQLRPAIILPVAHLSAIERQSLRDVLRSQVAP